MSSASPSPDLPPASDKQRSYLASLLRERDTTQLAEPVEKITARLNQMTRREASSLIAFLAQAPKVAARRPSLIAPDVQAGHYALLDTTTGEVTFYLVDRPTSGKWAGRTFVSRQDGPASAPVKEPALRNNILRRIAADPVGALTLYGRLIGTCGACGLPLTDETSRERGIGPVCAKKRGL